MCKVIFNGALSHFSIGNSLLTPTDIAEQAEINGYECAVMTDVMTVSGAPEFTKACEARKVKPIIGINFNVFEDPTYKQPKGKKAKDAKPNPSIQLKLYPKSESGMKRIYKLLTLANSADYFHYIPRIGMEDIRRELGEAGEVFVVEPIMYGALHQGWADELALLGGKIGKSNLLLEVSPVNTPLFDKVNMLHMQLAKHFGIDVIPSRPIQYVNGEASESLAVLQAVTSNMKMADAWRPKQFVKDFEPMSKDKWMREVSEMNERIKNRYVDEAEGFSGVLKGMFAASERFVDSIEYKWQPLDISMPKMAKGDEFAELMRLCKIGWDKKLKSEVFGYTPSKEELSVYKERLVYELKILKEMKFDRYFLLVHFIVSKSNEMGVYTGPGRGSAAGSLVAYLLGITNADPIRFGLIFERFINPSRKDLPDADLDFMSTRRDDVIQMIRSTFGDEYVSLISNYSMLGTASSLRDAGRVCGLMPDEMKATSYVPKVHGTSATHEEAAEQVPDIDKFKKANPKVWDHAKMISGKMRSLGTHAAGVIVAGDKIENRGFLQLRDGMSIVNWDKRVVEDQGLVKMDILGLATLDILKIAVDLIKARAGREVDVSKINLDDPAVLKSFAEGKTVGIFQFESGGMRRLLKSLAYDGKISFEEIVATTALYRPGPMDSGMLDDYVSRKQGGSIISYDHENLEPVTAETYGVMVFQEQVMKASEVLAGYSLAEADNLRKIMGKKIKEAMEEEREKFVKGCESHIGMAEKKAGEIFDKIAAFAGYGFNKSHALAYTLISYQAMWLKTYYPAEFYAASMTITKEDKLSALVKDAAEHDILIMPPDINISGKQFIIGYDEKRDKQALYAPFNRVKGASDKTADAIIEGRAKAGGRFESFKDFSDNTVKRSCNIRVQENLRLIGTFAGIEPGSLDPLHPDRLKDQKILMPGLAMNTLKADRKMRMNLDETAEFKRMLATLEVKELTEEERQVRKREREACELLGDDYKPKRKHPLPFLGKNAKVMVVTDYPSFSEVDKGQMTKGNGFDYISRALKEAGITKQDCYFTSLVKCGKEKGKEITMEQVKQYADYLADEVRLLKPSIIVAFGGKTIRHFVPDVKGGFEDLSGQSHYLPKLDATIFFGINPMMVYMQSERQHMLDEVMKQVAETL